MMEAGRCRFGAVILNAYCTTELFVESDFKNQWHSTIPSQPGSEFLGLGWVSVFLMKRGLEDHWIWWLSSKTGEIGFKGRKDYRKSFLLRSSLDFPLCPKPEVYTPHLPTHTCIYILYDIFCLTFPWALSFKFVLGYFQINSFILSHMVICYFFRDI